MPGTTPAETRLSNLLDQIDAFTPADPSDFAENRADSIREFVRLLLAFKRGVRIIQDTDTRNEAQRIPEPSDIEGVYAAHAAVCALSPEIRDELQFGGQPYSAPSRLKAFISYSNSDRIIAGQVKEFLELHGVPAFLAHEDITVSQEWKERIVQELAEANIVIPILSQAFKSSEWTSQEIGYAYAKGNVLFIPIRNDQTTPYGFISHIQGKPIPTEGISHNLLIDPIVNAHPHLILPKLIERLGAARSFRGAEGLMEPLVAHFSRFDDDEINSFARVSAENGQIWDAAECRLNYLPQFLTLHESRIEPSIRLKLKYQVEHGEHYRTPVAES
jgi:hypothetical protein